MSRVRRKYGSWSIAQGMRHAKVAALALPPPKTLGNELPKDGAACMAGKAILPILEVPSNPNTPLTWFTVMAFQMRTIFGSDSRDCGCRHLVHSNVQSVDSQL